MKVSRANPVRWMLIVAGSLAYGEFGSIRASELQSRKSEEATISSPLAPTRPNKAAPLEAAPLGKGEVNTGTNHLGFRCVKDAVINPRADSSNVQFRATRRR
jgi:hypothetical protein